MDALPAGCVSSYQELYQSVRGLSSEDAQMIERDVLRTAGAVRDGVSLFMDTTDSGKAGCARAMHRVLTAISVVDATGYCQVYISSAWTLLQEHLMIDVSMAFGVSRFAE